MSDSGMEELFFTSINVIGFIVAITVIIAAFTTGFKVNRQVSENVKANETVSAKVDQSIYKGFTDDGNIKYDGQLTGAEAIQEIISRKETYDVFLIQSVGNKINLTNTMVDETPLLEYAKDSDVTVLSNMFSVNQEYVRKYDMDHDGNIIAVTYQYYNGGE